MKHEVQQFFRALRAKTSLEDEKFIRQYLSHQEQILFYRQRLADQRHSLDTAYLILQEVRGSDWINEKRIVRMALLHDVGKAAVFMPLWVRPTAVLLKKLLSSLLAFWVKKGSVEQSRLFYKYFYTYVFHPEIGAAMLKEIGTPREILTLVKLHHDPPSPNEPRELPVFRRADNMC